VAHLIKHLSHRSNQPFVSIDLGSLPEQLFESELFGYEKGAFTGAGSAKAGRMEAASGGTLFLDEIGNLSAAMQSKLLSALERREITRLGDTKTKKIDVRLICATNADLMQMVADGTFRQDLLYRINTIEIHIPPIRERGDDILLLADHLLAVYAQKYNKHIKGISIDAKSMLLKYQWPGNVRELQHTLERAVIMTDSSIIKSHNLMLQSNSSAYNRNRELQTMNLEELERDAIERAMQKAEGNISKAAELLGITRYTLYRKLNK
jgi:transcriptional regulator with PAS, ATPase and Fis domain